ncbi:MAG: dephospho-CoA kinase, partial [bacterium]
MIKAAITGNIGSGKSIVTRIFQSLGVPVFIADVEAKKLYELPDVKKEILELFGKRVFDDEGKVIKAALAKIILNDQVSLQRVNQIIHPRTLENYSLWLQHHTDQPYTLHESAILFENKLQDHFDKIINVYAPF